ncbi:MAG: hypothetical protein RQ741_11270 [Wenzhouxiangellaceae bacterium]|nr:hypothetical protein [Wenzhouxiangellaceae bacterium]
MIGSETCVQRVRVSAGPFLAIPGRAAASMACAACLLLSACASIPDASAPASAVEPLQRATTELPRADVLNVNIVRFDANIPSDPEFAEVEQIFEDIRRAESRYVPFTLRQTLQRSGHWGDVRVVPARMPGAELEVTGRILDSHGHTLSLAIQARDASGRQWLDKTYTESINEARYGVSSATSEDPFQSLYNRVANDLVEARAELDTETKREIARVAELSFAAELAPSVYGPRLERDNNGQLSALPVGQPDLLAGPIEAARSRDARMIDILDQHYNDFHSRMEVPYGDWREASYREMRNLQELRRQANTRKVLGALAVLGGVVGAVKSDGDLGRVASQVAIVGGIYAISSGIDKGRQTSIHVESLRELGRSLEQDLAPQNVDIKDKTVRLTGSAEAQYEQWREILAEMVAEQQQAIEDDAAERAATASDFR